MGADCLLGIPFLSREILDNALNVAAFSSYLLQLFVGLLKVLYFHKKCFEVFEHLL